MGQEPLQIYGADDVESLQGSGLCTVLDIFLTGQCVIIGVCFSRSTALYNFGRLFN